MSKTRLYKKRLQAPKKGCKLQRKGLQALALLLCLTMVSCRGAKEIVKEVPVYVHDTTIVEHTNTVIQRDTIITNNETIIREADSATLAALGIKLKDNERAILILKKELMQKIQLLNEMTSDSSYMSSQEPIIVTQTETIEVKKPLRWWQWLLMGIGVVAILAFVNYVYWSWKLYRK